jgi:hypothetical protein
MKLLLVSIFSFLLFSEVKCQIGMLPKAYNYLSEEENWTLRLFDNNKFELLVGMPYDNSRLVLEGEYIMTDSTFQFKCTPSVNLGYIKKDTSLFKLNVKDFIEERVFSKIEDHLIPKSLDENKKYNPNKSYYHQVELNMGGTKIELLDKRNYRLTEYSCKGKWIEKGNYLLKGKFIIFNPGKNSIKLSTIMDLRQAVITKDFIITKKIEKSSELEKYLHEEAFAYFIRM